MLERQQRLGIIQALSTLQTQIQHAPEPKILAHQPTQFRAVDLGGFQRGLRGGIDRDRIETRRQDDDGVTQAVEDLMPKVQFARRPANGADTNLA
jgi:hypothetical protein